MTSPNANLHRNRRWQLGLYLALAVSVRAFAADPIGETRSVAQRGLGTFRKLVGEDSYRTLGFTSLEEARTKSELGLPIIVHTLNAEQLTGAPLANAPTNVPGPVHKVIWPVMVGERTCASITVSQTKGIWKATRYGLPNFTRQLDHVRAHQAKLSNLPPADIAAAEVPLLQLWLVAFVDDQQLQVAPLESHAELGLSSNERKPAKVAFAAMTPVILRRQAFPHLTNPTTGGPP